MNLPRHCLLPISRISRINTNSPSTPPLPSARLPLLPWCRLRVLAPLLLALGMPWLPAAAAGLPSANNDDILGFAIERETGNVLVTDRLNQKSAASVKVCPRPEAGVLSRGGIHFLVLCSSNPAGSITLAYLNSASFAVEAQFNHVLPEAPTALVLTPDGRHALLQNGQGNTLAILDVAARKMVPQISPPAVPRTSGPVNQVLVMGLIHGEHKTSTRYGIDTLSTLLKRIKPDVVLTEIPPDRFEAASSEFAATGQITEKRVKSFPEYTHVLFPLQKELGYQIVPTAGWTLPMHNFRVAALKRLGTDPARAKEWAEYQAADQLSDQMLAKGGAPDDPAWIHSDEYDRVLEIGLSAYNRFNADLGPGGWDNINASHYGHIARWLDVHAYQGKRVLITYGAGHKGWFLRQLRQRKDIQLLEMKPFL